MPNEDLIAQTQQRLRENRSTRDRRAVDLRDLEADAASLRNRIAALDRQIAYDEAEITRLRNEPDANQRPATPSDDDLEDALRRDAAAAAVGVAGGGLYGIPGGAQTAEPAGTRFNDRTIPQATAMILRERGMPLHVNDIYQHLLAGGFTFTGHNPTISIAVSLNRNRRFRKVAPGTFDLVMRDAAQVKF